MESIVLAFFVPAVAMILDSLFGDPQNLPHPVRYIGQGLDLFEASARRVGLNLRTAGWIAVILFAVGAWSVAEVLISIPYIGILIAFLSRLRRTGYGVSCQGTPARLPTCWTPKDLAGARKALSMLVSRDTSKLDPGGHPSDPGRIP